MQVSGTFPELSDGRKKTKVRKVMHEFKEQTLRSGSKPGPKVKSRAQAVAIALDEAGVGQKGMSGRFPRKIHAPGSLSARKAIAHRKIKAMRRG